MTRTALAILAGLAFAFMAAQSMEGVMSTGVISGYLVGAAVGLVGADWQRRLLVSRPKLFMLGSVVSFLLTLLGLMTGAILLRYVDALAAVADYRTFTVSFGCAAFLAVVVGAFDNIKVLKEESAL